MMTYARRLLDSKVLWIDVLLYALAFVVGAALIYYRHAHYMADDGGFFLRYAENIAHGYGWRFNIDEPPVWGASAPFWPAIIAGPIALGVRPFLAITGVGAVMTLAAFLLVVHTLRRHFGWWPALFFVAVGMAHHWIGSHATSGLESPMAMLLIALGFWSLLTPRLPTLLYVAVGFFLINHKLDFAPIGFAYLFALFFCEHTRQRALRITLWVLGGTALWLAFTYFYFGSVVPTSVARKFEVASGGVQVKRNWFLSETWEHGGLIRITPIVPLGLIFLAWRRLPVFFFLGSICSHMVLYTILPPSEPFSWYLVPQIWTSTILAAIGVALLLSLQPRLPRRTLELLAVLVVVGTGYEAYKMNRKALPIRVDEVINGIEADRSELGMWMDQNLPKDAKIETYFGNTGYWSHRYVYDSSFLNRAVLPGEDDPEHHNVLAHYKPEATGVCWGADRKGNRGMHTQMEPILKLGYRPVKYFGKARDRYDFYCVALVRNDLPIKMAPDSAPYFKP